MGINRVSMFIELIQIQNQWKSLEHSPSGLTSSYTLSHNVPWFHSFYTLLPQLYRVDLFDVVLFHISNRCQWAVELSYPFQNVFPVFPGIDSAASTCHYCSSLPPLGLGLLLSFLGSFPIMHIVDLCCFLHSVNMSLGGNFQSSYFHDSGQCDIFIFFDDLCSDHIRG